VLIPEAKNFLSLSWLVCLADHYTCTLFEVIKHEHNGDNKNATIRKVGVILEYRYNLYQGILKNFAIWQVTIK
jgi:hypothetical protein